MERQKPPNYNSVAEERERKKAKGVKSKKRKQQRSPTPPEVPSHLNKVSDENMQLHSFGANQSEVVSKTETNKEQQPEVVE